MSLVSSYTGVIIRKTAREKAESLENAEFNFLHVHVRIHVHVQVLNLSDNHI